MSLPIPSRAIILAAGYGTRLYPLTIDRAKPAIPFLNRPLVGYVAEYLARHGCREVAVNLHHEAASIREALGDGTRFGVRLHYTHEPEILGTGGALINARGFLEEDTFIVINGKIITDVDLSAALETHRRTRALATLVLRFNPQRERFSTINVADDNRITSFGGMPLKASDNGNGLHNVESSNALEITNVPLMFTGIQILEPEIFSYIPAQGFSHTVTDVYPQAIARGERVIAHIADGAWYEMSTIERYLDISLTMLRGENLTYLCGENCLIAETANVKDCVLWNDVLVESDARLEECVLGDGVRIPPHSRFNRAAIVRAELVRGVEPPPKALAGEFIGENFVVPLPR